MKVTYEDHMGTDLSIVNAAKVSFGKRSKWENDQDDDSWIEPFIGEVRVEMRHPNFVGVLSKQDQSLIQFLARGCTSGDWEAIKLNVSETLGAEYLEPILNYIRKMPSHWSPFAHTAITLHLKMPIFVARQIMKHTTGIEYNEVSRRYVDSEPEFYKPDVWRGRSEDKKQGSTDEEVNPCDFYGFDSMAAAVNSFDGEQLKLYNDMLAAGVAPEQARMVLPQSMYTEVIATGNLYAWANLYIQRSDSHAQKETQEVAKQIGDIIQPLFPVSWEALTR
jgi:thymidylate synthase (FAD)